MEDHTDRELTGALRALAESERQLGASASVETRLREELVALRSASRRQRRVVAAVYALAAALVLAVLIPAVRLADRQPAQVSNGAERVTSDRASAMNQTNAFVPLVYSSSPFVGGQIVRLEVPRAAVERFGLVGVHAVEESRPGTVLADVFVGDDGLARAVRFVQPVVSASGSRLQETQR